MGGKPRRNPVTDAQIVATYREHGAAKRAARVLGISEQTVLRVLIRAGIERTGTVEYRKRLTRFQGQEQEIRAWYESGETLEAIRRRLGGASDWSIKHAIRRIGGELRSNPIPVVKPGERERIVAMHEASVSQMKIAIAIGRSQGFVGRELHKGGVPFGERAGKNHNRWRGGRFQTGGGYYRVWVDQSDSMASMRNNTGHVLEHRLVMARALDRPLLAHETVHHINGDRADNTPQNLQLRQGRHGKGVALTCLDCGSH